MEEIEPPILQDGPIEDIEVTDELEANEEEQVLGLEPDIYADDNDRTYGAEIAPGAVNPDTACRSEI